MFRRAHTRANEQQAEWEERQNRQKKSTKQIASEARRKTALMQRVNQAYEKTNLLQLLEVQLEIEQIDHATIANLGDISLKQYNKILRDQVCELDTEIVRFEDHFRLQFGIVTFAPVAVNTILSALATEIAQARRTVRKLKKDLQAVQDPARLKPWLKTLQRDFRNDDLFFLNSS